MPIPAGPTVLGTYASLDELKERKDIKDTIDDVRLQGALDAATADIDRWCRRNFRREDEPSARRFRPTSRSLVLVDDFWTTDGLTIAVDDAADGTYAQAWALGDVELEPLDGIVDGVPGWPYCRLVGVGDWPFPVNARRPSVRVTARWGWVDVPEPVHESCLILAAESFKLGDAPFGVAGFGEFGPMRVQGNSIVQGKLKPYRRLPTLVA